MLIPFENADSGLTEFIDPTKLARVYPYQGGTRINIDFGRIGIVMTTAEPAAQFVARCHTALANWAVIAPASQRDVALTLLTQATAGLVTLPDDVKDAVKNLPHSKRVDDWFVGAYSGMAPTIRRDCAALLYTMGIISAMPTEAT